jgi:hypothetical protein
MVRISHRGMPGWAGRWRRRVTAAGAGASVNQIGHRDERVCAAEPAGAGDEGVGLGVQCPGSAVNDQSEG